MRYSEPSKQIDAGDFTTYEEDEAHVGTTIELRRFKEANRNHITENNPLSAVFSAQALKKQILVSFLQRLIGLSAYLGDFEIKFVTTHARQGINTETLKKTDLPILTSKKTVMVDERDPKSGEKLGTQQIFELSYYRLDVDMYDLPKNSIAFCAKSSPVKDITSYYLRTKAEQNRPVEGFHHIVLIESEFFDIKVNEQRDDFDNIPQEIPSSDLFLSEKISYKDIHAALDDIIEKMVMPADWNKNQILKDIANQFGVGEAMLTDTDTRIRHGDTAQAVVERVLKKYQERVINETAEIYQLKNEIMNVEPNSDEFRSKINELSWKYASSLKNFDMANLSQLIVRRAAIVDILDLACTKSLGMQLVSDGKRRKDEEIIHSIFFPMRKDNLETTDHDIWLLSEEYHYYDYIASDKPLSSINWSDENKVFDEDIDEKFQELLDRRSEENSGKRPDIAIFNKEGSAIIIEFKAPGVKLDEHIGDLTEYAHLLAAKSGGKLRKFYCYLIGDKINALRISGWTQFPVGKGWFQSTDLRDPETGRQLGELYSEILYFKDVVDRAKKRIGIYQKKINLNLQR